MVSGRLYERAKDLAGLYWPVGRATYIRQVPYIPAWWNVGEVRTFDIPGGERFKMCYYDKLNQLLVALPS